MKHARQNKGAVVATRATLDSATAVARFAGFSLIELMISMAIGLIVTLAITSVMIRSESNKRTSTSVNDVNQNGAFITYTLDRNLRNAGSGFAQSWSLGAFGCRLDITASGVRLLPRPAAFPISSAFVNVPQTLRLAPVLIGKGMADTGTEVRGDVLFVMGGQAGGSEMPMPVTPGSITSNNFRMANSLGYRTGDVVLLMDPAVSSGCLLQQVAWSGSGTGSTDQNIPLGGTYSSAAGTNVSLTNFGGSTLAAQFGNPANNPPMFQLFGVGANSSFFTYDLMQPSGSTADITLSDGVVEMRALYGLDTTNPPDGVIDSWMNPVVGSGYDHATLNDGSTSSQAKIRQIVAVRVGFIMRTNLPEKTTDITQPAGTALNLFSDLGSALTQTRTLSASELSYRFRTIEIIVPLPNVLLAPQL